MQRYGYRMKMTYNGVYAHYRIRAVEERMRGDEAAIVAAAAVHYKAASRYQALAALTGSGGHR